jgi:transcriptional regulator with XRE-family HTH domain
MNPNTSESFTPVFQKAEKESIFWEEMAILGFTESVLEHLDIFGVSKKELAEKMNVSPAFVTKMISGRNNFTLRTMVKVARALDCEFQPKLRPLKECARWLSYRSNAPLRSLVFPPLAKKSLQEEAFRPIPLSAENEGFAAAA